MKSISRRAWVLHLMAVAFLCGVGFLLYTFFTNADSWSMKKANRHIYSSSSLTAAGSITDESGEILAKTVDGKREYNESKAVRTATMHIVGDPQGYIASGVQSSYKDVLTGYNIVDGIYDLKKYGTGSDIQLTINAELCKTAYQAMGSNKGTVGVYNYKTGELLCVVSKPSYDISNKPVQSINNDKTGEYDGVYLNRFFSGVYTPGSTFKVITSACAIDNIPDIEDRSFKCGGEYKIDGSSVKCLSNHHTIGFEKALNKSCNSAFAQIAVELGTQKLTQTAQTLGFGKSLKVGNINTAKSSFDVSKATKLDLGWAGIGQYTTRVNPCHMLTIVGAVANGGTSPSPYFIKTITSPTGKVTFNAKTEMLEPMFTQSTAAKLNELLRSDVENGYGDYKFSGLEMCGKTGTAEVSSEDGGLRPHAWFVGYSQREDLPLAIVVVAENGGSASSVAIPIANKTMQKAAKLFS